MRTINQQLLTVDPRTASGDSGVVDTCRGYDDVEHSARFYLDVATPTGTTPTLTVFIYGVVGGSKIMHQQVSLRISMPKRFSSASRPTCSASR